MRTAPLLAALLLAAAAAAAAPPSRDPDWPCQQVKMAALSIGAVWTGPPLDAYFATWSHDPEIADLVPRLTERRTPLDEAERAIRDFAAAAGAQRRDKLLALMAGVFSTLDAERAQVIAGLDRFGRRQKELASQIRADFDTQRTQPSDELGERLGWETRLFEQRRLAVGTACDVPNLIEQRLGALARAIQAALG